MINGRALALVGVLVGLLAFPAAAAADFGFESGSISVVPSQNDGTPVTQASSHPYDFTVSFNLNTGADGFGEGGDMRDVITDLPPGFVGNPFAVPRCPRQLFEGFLPKCPPSTQVGVLRISGHGTANNLVPGPIYNMVPPPGVAAQLAFSVANFNALQNALVRSEEGYGLRIGTFDVPTQIVTVDEEIWGVPADPSHDAERGALAAEGNGPPVASDAPQQAFLTMPASCQEPLQTTLKVDSKLAPGVFDEHTVTSMDSSGQPMDLSGCNAVPFSPQVSASPTSKLAENPSGLDFELRLPNQGLESPGGIAETEPEKVRFALPEGVTVNPSFAEGIVGCSPAQYKAETISSAPGAGCPEASKLGSLVVQTPLLEEPLEGSLYLASPHDNPFNSLAALYMVGRAPERGVIVKQAGKIELDHATGQVVTTFENLPPIPFSSFQLHFREGGRAPLVTPPGCGEYRSVGELFPFSNPTEATPVTASFQIEHGAEGGACPTGGTPPFHPLLTAGTLNNAAGRYSPFNLRLTRTDSEQEFTHFSIKLPPGLVGKLAGIPFCPEADIALARAREHEGGGAEELSSPSCPKASEIGHTLVGAGVGSALTYVPGKLYLAGPYHGSSLSIVAVTAAKVGPFDVGTVVIREALKVNPETAEVFIDATGSDPIPHIVDGVPVHARDIRVYTDRPEFTLNPTSCKRTSTASTVLGSGTDFASEADDQPVTVTSPFQAADCASLGFAPKLALSLKGGTKRNDNPALKAVVSYPQGAYANIAAAQVTLPHSEFLDQEHIKTICTRVQFKEGTTPGEKCPAASIYGYARAQTPLLAEELKGPVYLRSSSHNLPDLVPALNSGEINVDLDGHIDSVKGGRIRTTFEAVPDAPVTKFTLEMQGGKKGLLVNSTDLCKAANKALAAFTGQNGKLDEFSPVVKPQCGAKAKHKAKARAARSSRPERLNLSRHW